MVVKPIKGGFRIRNVGFHCTFTSDTADTELQFTGRGFEKTFIITMDMQTAGMSAGTGELVKLQIGDKIIIKNYKKLELRSCFLLQIRLSLSCKHIGMPMVSM